MHGLEPFLLMLSSVFVPLYGTILGRLGGARDVAARVGATAVDWTAVGIWVAGVACFHLLPKLAPVLGAALPTLALTFVLARLTRR
jgi:NCS1 family nucleobase:cation symporter-1